MNYLEIYRSLILKRKKYPANKEFQYSQNHHIIPRSINKSLEKDQSNIVSLSARQHFIAHALLVKIYKQKGDKEGWYKMLSAFDAMSKLYGSIRNPELRYKNKSNSKLYQIWKIELSNYIKESGCRRGKNSSNYGKICINNPETKEVKYIKASMSIPDGWQRGNGEWIKHIGSKNKVLVHNIITDEQKYINKNQLKVFLKENPNFLKGVSKTSATHQQHYNPTKDKIWITNIQLRQSKLIDKNSEIPNDWLKGKILNFQIYLERYNDALHNHIKWHFIDLQKDLSQKIIPRLLKNRSKPLNENKNYQKSELAKLSLQEKINLFQKYYQVYKSKGFKGVKNQFNYKHSIQNLIKMFKKYLNI